MEVSTSWKIHVLAQNVYHDVHVSWKDYTRGSDGKLTLVTLCSGADHADVIRQTSVQVFRRFNQDWSKQQTRKLITFHLYNPEKASPSVLIQGHDTMKWAQESDRVRCLVHHLDARWADSATCLSECRDLPLVLPDFHGYIRTPHQEVGNPLREGGLPAVTACSWVASPSTGVDRGCCHIQQRGSGGPHQHLDCNHHRLCFSSRHPSLGCSSDCPHCGNNHLSNAIWHHHWCGWPDQCINSTAWHHLWSGWLDQCLPIPAPIWHCYPTLMPWQHHPSQTPQQHRPTPPPWQRRLTPTCTAQTLTSTATQT